MSLWPKEHGAYGQVVFPLTTAFAVAGLSIGGALTAVAVLAGFVAHEPAAVLLGLRGPRARRELRRPATALLAACLVAGAIAGAGAVWAMDPSARWSMAVPAVPALLLVLRMLRNQEKSWPGETAAAVAFSTAAIPVTMSAGGTLQAALTVAMPFALLFVTSTLAVRVVILRVRGGGDPRAADATRYAAIALTAAGTALLVLAATAGVLSSSVLLAAAPGLLTAGAIALHPPPPRSLRRVGWTLVAVSIVTAVLIVSTA
jgi:hypothetical protein